MKMKDFDSNGITFFHGDCLLRLKELSTESVDAVLTDPTYSSGGLSLAVKQQAPAKKYQLSGTKKSYPPMLGDNKDQRSFTVWAILWLSECWRIARDGAPLMVFTDWRQLPSVTDAIQGAGWLWLGIVPWNKRSCRPSIGRFRQQCEYVVFGSKGKLKAETSKCLPGLYDHPVIPQHKVHITGKPVDLFAELLEASRPGGTVLDPFIGGGTTALAALKTGRKCIGVELSKDYFDLSVGRIQDFFNNIVK